MKPTVKQPLFVISGASGIGKTSLCNVLFQNETDYIVLDADILWNKKVYDTPGDGYQAFRKMCMRLCAGISQIGKPVVLCGCATPEQFEPLQERELFTKIHYLAVVSDDAVLEDRLRNGRKISDEGHITTHIKFNNRLRENGAAHDIFLLDNSNLTVSEGAEIADEWILTNLHK